MRGRKPKPEHLKRIDDRERIIGGKDPPQPPAWLTGFARAEWDRLIAELSKSYLVTPLDAVGLATYCRTYELWLDADRVVREQGITFIADNGNVRCNPAAKLCLSLFESLRRMAAEYGFTPAARSRLDAPKPPAKEEDEFETFLEAR